MLVSVVDTRRTVFAVRVLPTPAQLAETAEAVGVVASVQGAPPQLAGSQCPSACKACKLVGQVPGAVAVLANAAPSCVTPAPSLIRSVRREAPMFAVPALRPRKSQALS